MLLEQAGGKAPSELGVRQATRKGNIFDASFISGDERRLVTRLSAATLSVRTFSASSFSQMAIAVNGVPDSGA
jgi:hypothetical protein